MNNNVIWVDDRDNVIGEVTRRKAHKEGLLHRVAVIYLVNDKGEILVNERAKDGHLDHSSAGHVDAGEEYFVAAKRELEEELGVAGVQLRSIGSTQARDVGKNFDGEAFDSRHMFRVYVCKANPVRLKEDEVKSVYWAKPENVLKDMQANPKKYTEGFKSTIKLFLIIAEPKVLETTRIAVEKSKYVKIDREKITEFAKTFKHRNVLHWLSGSPLSFSHLSDEEKLNFLLVFNSTSFCYWGDPKWMVEYRGERYDGSWGMVAAILRALENGKPILDAKYRSKISRREYQEILGGNVEIPLFEERWKITKEVAAHLMKNNGGSFTEFVKQANGDAVKLLGHIIRNFPSFDDTAIFYGQKIEFYKRAQLLVADIYQLFDRKGYGNLTNAERLTACADYKLPQSLRTLGIISYTKSLAEKVDSKTPLIHGEQEEIDIRANTIWAIEFIRQELEKIGKRVMPIGINDHLWLMGQDKSKHEKPYHRTVTAAY